MKIKCLKFKLMMLAVIVAMSSCISSCSDSDPDEDFYIWDFFPVEVAYQVVDNEGNDLIAVNGSLYQADFSINYNGETFSAQWTKPGDESRYYLPRFNGLSYLPAENGELARLVFGELDGTHVEADLVLKMPDGTQHDLHISRRITTKGPDIFASQTVTFDGEVIDSLTDGSPYMVFKIVVQ